jgi:transcriptional regulator with XRE-family HTH domain
MAGAESFGERVRRLREARGKTLAAVAEECGCSEGTIRHIEVGNVASPGLHLGIRLADALGVDVRYLAFGGAGVAGRVPDLARRVEAWKLVGRGCRSRRYERTSGDREMCKLL